MTPLARVVLALAETIADALAALWLAAMVPVENYRLAREARRWQGRYPDRPEDLRVHRRHPHSGHGRRVHRCQHCGAVVPPDPIRLTGGRRYCPSGDCRVEAERLIAVARAVIAREGR
jgi:hypothetical protein